MVVGGGKPQPKLVAGASRPRLLLPRLLLLSGAARLPQHLRRPLLLSGVARLRRRPLPQPRPLVAGGRCHLHPRVVVSGVEPLRSDSAG